MTSPSRAPRLLSTGQAAVELGVHERTLRRYITLGQIGYHRLPGGHYRVPREAIEQFWREHEGADASAAARPRRSRRQSSRPAGKAARARRPLLERQPASYELTPERLSALRAEFDVPATPAGKGA
jgi:excisionase family DNA binding protein